MKELPFLYLTLDLPAAPLYRDEQMQNIIPQIPLSALFAKYDGIVEKVRLLLLYKLIILLLRNTKLTMKIL